MSELKPYIGPHPTGHTLTEYYLKSEADKVIASHKYKRCLAMAWWCDTKGDWYYSLGESFRNRVDFHIKWRDKWLELAEKFKEAKQC